MFGVSCRMQLQIVRQCREECEGHVVTCAAAARLWRLLLCANKQRPGTAIRSENVIQEPQRTFSHHFSPPTAPRPAAATTDCLRGGVRAAAVRVVVSSVGCCVLLRQLMHACDLCTQYPPAWLLVLLIDACSMELARLTLERTAASGRQERWCSRPPADRQHTLLLLLAAAAPDSTCIHAAACMG